MVLPVGSELILALVSGLALEWENSDLELLRLLCQVSGEVVG